MKIFKKEKLPNRIINIYFCGYKIFSYKRKFCIKYINKNKLDKKIRNFSKTGINKKSGRNPKIIVSLTSFPQRIKDIHYGLYSLLKQTLKPDLIVLWLGENKFPNKEKDLPESLLNLINNGITIKWCNDIGSYTKLIPSLKEFPNDIIITVDDDIFYPDYLIEKLYKSYLKNPTCIYCMRAHKVTIENNKIISYNSWKHCIHSKIPSFNNFLTGVGGVLYPPNCLYEDVLKADLFMKLAPKADDVWFWGMAVLNKTKISIVNGINYLVYINPERELGLNGEFTLSSSNCGKSENDIQINNVVNYYNIINTIKMEK